MSVVCDADSRHLVRTRRRRRADWPKHGGLLPSSAARGADLATNAERPPKVRGDEHDRAKHSACCCGGKVLSVPTNGTLKPALFPETPGWRSSPRPWR